MIFGRGSTPQLHQITSNGTSQDVPFSSKLLSYLALSGSGRLIKIHFVHLRQLFIYYEQAATLNKQLTPSSLSQHYIAKTIHPAHQQLLNYNS